MPLSPGTRLGPYEILSPLGAGGMGEVYRARDAKLPRAIALKVLPAEFAADVVRRQRFEQEARTASSLNHPSIVHVYDVGFAGSVHYIAMELVEGKSLREMLAAGPVPPKKVLEMAVEIADGLAKAHAAGIVHRDIKPENLLVTAEGHVKILDFGLAKLNPVASGDLAEESTSPKLTRAGMVLGTVGYMSPEQASGREADFRSDQFVLGSVLYEMASGKRPFDKETGPETLTAILRETPEPLARLNPLLPVPLRWIVEERCLAKEPEDRYASTRDLLRELRTVRDHLSDVTAAAPSARPAQRLWLTAGSALGAGLLLGGLTAYIVGKGSVGNPPPPEYRQITFSRGTIWSARFAPDGETIVYGAAWDGRAVEPFLTRLAGPESRALGFPGAEILAVSSAGEVAISLERRHVNGWQLAGRLARVALTGGSPRPLLEDVQYADWGPDGKSLAVVREVDGKNRLEYPIGTVLYETAGWISHPRVSPRNDQVAFLDHPVLIDDLGSVAVVDRSGNRRTLTDQWSSAAGLAWSATGHEVWFTAARSGGARTLHAVTLAGVERTIAAVPGSLTLHDISREGRVLLGRDGKRVAIRGVLPGSEVERDVSALDFSIVRDLSPDGATLLIEEEGEGAGTNYAIYLRSTQTDSPPMLLGEGSPLSLSPDGKWILALVSSERRHLLLVPTGAGEIQRLNDSGLEYQPAGTFVPGGRRVVCLASEPGRAGRLYVQEVEGGRVRAISPEGVATPLLSHPVSPDGALVAAIGPDNRPTLYPVDGGEPRAIIGAEAGEEPVRFSSDGRSLFLFQRGRIPGRVFRIDLAGGRRSLWKEIAPSDPAGITRISTILPTPDGRFYVYGFHRLLSELYVAEGLR